jgi:RNA polymerase sigma-70 factor (ECF subfamily)
MSKEKGVRAYRTQPIPQVLDITPLRLEGGRNRHVTPVPDINVQIDFLNPAFSDELRSVLAQKPEGMHNGVYLSSVFADRDRPKALRMEVAYLSEGRLERYFLRRTGNLWVAQDFSSEVLTRVGEKMDYYQHQGKPLDAWLLRLAHNFWVDDMKRQKHGRGVAYQKDESDIAIIPPDQELDKRSTAQIDNLTKARDLTESMQRLTDDQQRVIRLRFLEGMTLADTADAMGRTRESVKKLQARALHTMRKFLGRDYYESAFAPKRTAFFGSQQPLPNSRLALVE